MRRDSLYMMALLASSLTVASGCSDLTAGDTEPPKGPPHLTRLTVQDRSYTGAGRASVVDLLDHAAPVACAVDNPCVTQYLIAQTQPDLSCGADGFCLDALKLPAAGMPLNADANTIRLVFDKPLNPNIETINLDPHGAQVPGQTNALNAGIVEVIGPDGTSLNVKAFWDPTGSPTFTSDPILVPYGPAIVINPVDTLVANAKYTVRLHPKALVDERTGQPAVLYDGSALGDPMEWSFTTEALTLGNNYPPYPDPTNGPAQIAPNDVVQFPFWEDVDLTTLKNLVITGPAGFDATHVEFYLDQGSDPTACGDNPTRLDFIYTDGAASKMPIDWPAGDYSLGFSITQAGGSSALDVMALQFTVGDDDVTDPAADPNIASEHVTPEQCQ